VVHTVGFVVYAYKVWRKPFYYAHLLIALFIFKKNTNCFVWYSTSLVVPSRGDTQKENALCLKEHSAFLDKDSGKRVKHSSIALLPS
jgi:hypothetical protein